MPSNAELGCAVRRARKLTIETLAFAADMHPTYLSGIERGVRNPTWDKITSLARGLKSPSWSLSTVPKKRPRSHGSRKTYGCG